MGKRREEDSCVMRDHSGSGHDDSYEEREISHRFFGELEVMQCLEQTQSLTSKCSIIKLHPQGNIHI